MTALGIDLEKTNERGEVVLVDPTPEIKTAVATDVADPESAIGQALSGTYVPVAGDSKQITGPFFWRGGAGNTPIVAKPLGDGNGGVFDITNDDTTGYLFHTHSGVNSGPLAYHYGGGADQGSGGVFLYAAKNAGKGISGTSHPSHTGIGVHLTFFSSAASSFVMDQYAGSQGAVVQQKLGKGFPDGVTVGGSTTFTSATAAFVGGDVGKAISQTTSRGEAYGIDTGTTISSVTNGTTVILSKPALASSTGINFLIADRAVPAGQKFISFFDSAAKEVFSIANSSVKATTVFEVVGLAAVPNSVLTSGSVQKYYAWEGTGTNYVTSQINVDGFGLRIEHYLAAAKGAEASSVRSFIGRNVGGVPYVGFLGASAIPRRVATADASDLATAITLANALKADLIAFGLKNA